MRQCPWCGRQNLNCYAYCMSCGRGFDGPEQKDEHKEAATERRSFWLFGRKKAA